MLPSPPMQIVGLIPARFGATRFPGKLIAPLCGQPMLHWVLKGCLESDRVSRWIVATDNDGIAAVAQANGIEAVMTDPDLRSGTDRIWAVAKDLDASHVINVQGDEPLIDGHALNVLVDTLCDGGAETATLARPLDPDEKVQDPNRVKVVVGTDHRALYFSRAVIPYPRNPEAAKAATYLLHLGCYGYTHAALARWVALPPHPLELVESLEQLRAIANGISMAVGLVDTKLSSVDAPADVPAVESALRVRYGL